LVSAIEELLYRLADCSFARRFLEVVFAARSRWRLARLDHTAPARSQLRTLLGLVHRARSTPFGREHDFARIRTEADFRRLTPLRTRAELWRQYGQAGLAWPDNDVRAVPLPCLGQDFRPVAISRELLLSRQLGLRTAFSLLLECQPRARLLAGPILWLGDDSLLATKDGRSIDAAGLAGSRFPSLLRPAVRAALPTECLDRRRENDLPLLARSLAHEAPTCIVGPGERIAALLEQVHPFRNGEPWGSLAGVLCTRRDPACSPDNLRRHLHHTTPVLQMLDAPEGPLAVEDPRFGGLRLLCDHGVYFELVPVDQLDQRHPPRLGVGEAKVGVPYEVAVSSPAGVWACLTGLRICFDRLSPPLVRVLPARVEAASPPTGPAVRSDAPSGTPAPLSQRQSIGPPTAHRETLVQSPWSAHS
jgi:hypothetical protein